VIRVNTVLVLAVMATAFTLVHTQYQSRRLYAAVDKARAHATDLDTDWESLRAQRRIESASARVQRIAREQLNMRAPDPATTLYLSPLVTQEQRP
jgi:cell division protein FtsL